MWRECACRGQPGVRVGERVCVDLSMCSSIRCLGLHRIAALPLSSTSLEISHVTWSSDSSQLHPPPTPSPQAHGWMP